MRPHQVRRRRRGEEPPPPRRRADVTDITLSLRATRIGGAAFRYLAKRPHRGGLVSAFSGGVNILFAGGGAFVPLQTSAIPFHPWAVEVPSPPLRLPEGTPVFADGGELSVGDVRVLLSNARVDRLALPRMSEEEGAVARRRLPLLARSVGTARPPDPFQPRIDAIIDRWLGSNGPEVLLDLIGLGAGSTPTGDDFLIGILAGMSLFERADGRTAEALSLLRSGIRETAGSRTPLPSAQMLISACDRSFAEPILALLEGLTSPAIPVDGIAKRAGRVAQLGDRSGGAILSGLAEVLRAQAVPDHRT